MELEWQLHNRFWEDRGFLVFVNRRQGWSIQMPMPNEACMHAVARDLRLALEMELISLDASSDAIAKYVASVIGAWFDRHPEANLAELAKIPYVPH